MIRKINFSTKLILNYNLSFAQKINKTSNFIAIYESSFLLGTDNRQVVNFALLGGDDFSLSTAEVNLQDFIDNYPLDKNSIESLSSYIDDNFYFTNNKYVVFGDYLDNKLGYEENTLLKWEISDEKKIINNQLCQKATLKKYGRFWTAYFNIQYPFPLGPYKFNGLPGLIFEIYDTNKEYHFRLKSLKKENYNLKFSLLNYKFIDKEKYFKTIYNLKYSLAAYPPFEDPIFKKELLERIENEKNRENNPLELSIE